MKDKKGRCRVGVTHYNLVTEWLVVHANLGCDMAFYIMSLYNGVIAHSVYGQE